MKPQPHAIISTMRWGVWDKNLTVPQASEFLQSCYNEGFLKFDIADVYGNYTTEALFGKALKDSGINRNSIKISTKCGILLSETGEKYKIKSYNSSKEHIIQSVENSLKNLHTDYIDVLFLHKQDLLLNFDEVDSAFTELKLSGKVRNFGVNNFSLAAFDMLNKRIPLITNQINLSLLHPEVLFNDTLLQLGNYNKKIQIFKPLGDYFHTQNNNIKLNKALESISKKYSITIDQLLIAWILKIPYKITTILGSTNINRIKDQIKAFNVDLSVEDWYELLQISKENEF